MGKEPEYLTVGKTPLERVHKLLAKLDSIRRSKERGSVVLEAEKDLSRLKIRIIIFCQHLRSMNSAQGKSRRLSIIIASSSAVPAKPAFNYMGQNQHCRSFSHIKPFNINISTSHSFKLNFYICMILRMHIPGLDKISGTYV